MRWNPISGSVLRAGQHLQTGDYLTSPGGTCFAVQQSDGQLCVYAGADPNHNGGLVWSSTERSDAQGDYVTVMQRDGNLATYHGTATSQGPWLWSWTTTPPPAADDYFAQLDDHGVLTVYTGTPDAPGPALWGNFGVNPGARIEHVVVLMLENRGFDTALGFLYTPDDPPTRNVPALTKGESRFHGLAFEPGKPQTGTVRGVTVTRTPGRGVAGANSPGFDPGEEFEHVNTQLFGDAAPSAHPTMDGFLLDFGRVVQSETHPATDTVQVLKTLTNCFAPWDLPNLSRLARTYGVSDRWFSSVPTQTNPNRAFSLCGTSADEVNNGDIGGPWNELGVDTFVGVNTIFNTLSKAGMTSWAIYYNELYPPALVTNACYTELAFPEIKRATSARPRFQPLANFLAQARTGTLPRFSYLEPKWGGAVLDQEIHIDGNDYHPPSDVTHSEQMLQQLYQALTANRAAWAKTLVVIMFDEHGGTYDHVPPGPALPPNPPPAYVTRFGFDRYGVRVPNLFLSPFIAGGTVVRSPNGPAGTPFDHTSMLASLLDWCGIPRDQANLGARTAIAPNFWSVLNLPLPRSTDDAFAVIPAPSVGTRVQWGQRFYLRHAGDKRVVSHQTYSGTPGYSGWYPRLSSGDPVAYELRAGEIGDGYQPGVLIPAAGVFQLRSSEYNAVFGRANQPEWYNSLTVGEFRERNAIYLAATDVTAELTEGAWRIHAAPLTFGGTARFESVKYPGHYLSALVGSNYLYLSSKTDASTLWIVEPAPSGG